MSVLASLAGLFNAPMPSWAVIFLLAAGLLLHALQQAATRRRLDSHARSIGYMDRWANLVDERLEDLAADEEAERPALRGRARSIRSNRRENAGGAHRGRDLSTDQVRRLVGRISRARAA